MPLFRRDGLAGRTHAPPLGTGRSFSALEGQRSIGSFDCMDSSSSSSSSRGSADSKQGSVPVSRPAPVQVPYNLDYSINFFKHAPPSYNILRSVN